MHPCFLRIALAQFFSWKSGLARIHLEWSRIPAERGEPRPKQLQYIPASALPHLFHPFYRNKAHEHREGLGLGLYIAHEIATAHGGALTVQSTDDETCFTFRMPLL